MNRVAEDVFHIPLAPRNALNAYLLGDVLVDAGTPQTAKKLLRALSGHTVATHALTHAHQDHAGGTNAVAEALDVPVWTGERDAEAVETGRPEVADNWAKRVIRRFATFASHPVERRLREGDEIGHGFTVLDAPGHSPGHVAFWRVADRTLVCGDVWFNLQLPTLRPGLREPPKVLSTDPAGNRASARRLAALEPALVLFGHGPPLRDPAALKAFSA
jgi:glyoxylase-like metal-dependent hydrolase (beta-lactamase superfamily II)